MEVAWRFVSTFVPMECMRMYHVWSTHTWWIVSAACTSLRRDWAAVVSQVNRKRGAGLQSNVCGSDVR